MAAVFQIIATSDQGLCEDGIVGTGEWHAGISVDAPRTLCGVQLEGDDGYGPGPEKEGKVTCRTCRSVLAQVQSIRKWK